MERCDFFINQREYLHLVDPAQSIPTEYIYKEETTVQRPSLCSCFLTDLARSIKMRTAACLQVLIGVAAVYEVFAARPSYRYNAGGDAINEEFTWLAGSALHAETIAAPEDTGSSGRAVRSIDVSVPEFTPSSLFSSDLYCPTAAVRCTFKFDHLELTGFYEVQLYFAEIAPPLFSAGARQFDVSINGDKALVDFDVFAEVGSDVGLMKSFTVDAGDGITVSLEPVVEFAAIKGIALLPTCSDPSIPGESTCSLAPTHPDDIFIKRDMGGDGDGDIWLPADGSFQKSFPQFNLHVSDAIDMSAGNLPADVPMSLFQSHVTTEEGDLVFKIPLQDETYIVTLLFADILPATTPPREMDILLGGVEVLSGYKPGEEHGYMTAAAKKFTVSVTGSLEIVLKPVQGNPWLNGLTVEKLVKGHDETFLHVVIDHPKVVIDHDSSGSEIVDFTGVGSHTHEPAEGLLEYVEWESDGELIALSENVSIDLDIGTHRLGLTIFDTKTPSETLYASSQVTIAPLTNVPGVLIKSFFDTDPTADLFAPLLELEAGYATTTATFTAPNGKKLGRIYQIISRIIVRKDPHLFKVAAVGGFSSSVKLNGELLSSSNFKLLSPGVHHIDARFRFTSEEQWPISLLRAKEQGASRIFDLSELGYDLTDEAPVLTGMAPRRGSYLGGQTIFIEGIGFSPKNTLVVKWGNLTISGSAITVSPLADELTFVAPSGQVGELDVRVETSNGATKSLTFFSEIEGPLPVRFDNIKTIFDVGFANEKPTRVTWGPDGRLYVGTFAGRIYVLTVNEDYDLIEYEQLTGVYDQTSHLVLGLAFNPAQNGPDVLYISHGTINAQGGFCHEGRDAPYTGKVSLLTAPNYDKLEPLITGLPVSNHDHAINGIEFDTNGTMYVMVGGNTNAGIIHCALGELDESPLSAAMIRAPVLKPGFNGDVKYVNRFTGELDMDQKNGLDAELVPGVDVEGYVYGFRNAYDLLFTQDGHFFLTDNGPNKNFGLASTGANTTGPAPAHQDELIYVTEGNYYGHPNRNRGRTDSRQNKYYNLQPPTIPGVFEQAIAKLKSSSNGMDEYRSNTFNGALRGQIIVQLLNDFTYNIKLNPDRKTVEKVFQDVLPAMGCLDVSVGPGGALIGANLKFKKIDVTVPIVDTSTSLAHIYDIYPYRTALGKGAPYIVSGHGFSRLGAFQLWIDDFEVAVENYTDRRIYGTLPTSLDIPILDLLDVSVLSSTGRRFVYQRGIQFLEGKFMNQAPRPAVWSRLPDIPDQLGEVVSIVVGNLLFVMGQGTATTWAFNLDTQTWLPFNTYKKRLKPGHHHCIELYNDKIYILGGISKGSTKEMQIFDPSTNTWTYGPQLPIPTGSANSVLINDVVYYCGGIFYDVNADGSLNPYTIPNCSAYDLINGTWRTDIAPMPRGRNHAAATTDGSKMYVVGGRIGGNSVTNGFADVQIYDPVTNAWEDTAATGSMDPLPVARGGLGQAVYHDGLIYVFGGETQNGYLASPLKVYERVDILNLATGKWIRGEDMPVGLHGHWPVLHDGKIFIAGGGIKAKNSKSSHFIEMTL